MAYNTPREGGQPARAAYYVQDLAPRPRNDRPDNRADNNGGPGPADYGYSPSPAKRESAVQRLKRKVKTLYEAKNVLTQDYTQVQHELQHYKDRVVRTEESHRLEIQRLKKEVDYHRRLRAGADQRASELEGRLGQQQRQTSTFDEAQSSLIEQSQLLISKNAELTYKTKTLEAQVNQFQELQGCLEAQLNDVLHDRDRLEEELTQILGERHQGLAGLTLEEEGEDEGDDEEGQ